tara:strand:+ start:180 stop:665 length:486 start_codon:yes stop_codon:yes gene_type:complete
MIKYKFGKKIEVRDGYLDMDEYEELPIFDQLPSQEELSYIVKNLQSDGQTIGASNNFCYPDPIEGISKYERTNKPSQEHIELAHGMATKWHLLTREQQKNIKSGLDDDFLAVLNAAIRAYSDFIDQEARSAVIRREWKERQEERKVNLEPIIKYMKEQKYL